jgi:hypothetical protein
MEGDARVHSRCADRTCLNNELAVLNTSLYLFVIKNIIIEQRTAIAPFSAAGSAYGSRERLAMGSVCGK